MATTYDVTITAINGSAPNDGFIDPTTSYSYMNTASTPPTNVANGLAKMRANRRYKHLVETVNMMCNSYVDSVTAPAADANTPPTSITLRFIFEPGDSALVTADENNSGQFLTGTAAIKRCAARSMIQNAIRNIEYYDPTVVTGREIDGSANTGEARGPVIGIETIGQLTSSLSTAEAAVTVVKVS